MSEGGHRSTAKGCSTLKLWDADRLRAALMPPPVSPQPGLQPPGRKLRIGYVSADFCNHPTADLMQSALLLHDKSRFEIFLYAITRHDASQYRQVSLDPSTLGPGFPITESQILMAECRNPDPDHTLAIHIA